MKRCLTLLVILISFFISVLEVKAENIKFVQVTDTHISKDSEFSQKVLKAAVEDINKQEGVSFVVFTGDNIANPKEENLVIFANIIKNLNVPYYVVIGNHDVYKSNGMSKTNYIHILRESNRLMRQNKPNYKFIKKGFQFIIVDGAKEIIPGPAGYFRKDTLNWLDKTLTKNKNKTVVILQHFPIDYPENAAVNYKTHKTYKVEDYQKIIDQHENILAIISGHVHTNNENMKNGIYHISSPALLAIPHSYKIIDIITIKEFSPIIYTQLKDVDITDGN